eukprot:978517-Pleurochrysis_carterae.AAC.1
MRRTSLRLVERASARERGSRRERCELRRCASGQRRIRARAQMLEEGESDRAGRCRRAQSGQ